MPLRSQPVQKITKRTQESKLKIQNHLSRPKPAFRKREFAKRTKTQALQPAWKNAKRTQDPSKAFINKDLPGTAGPRVMGGCESPRPFGAPSYCIDMAMRTASSGEMR